MPRMVGHIWHEKYSLPYTDVLGFVACRVTSKVLGIGPCERGWGDVKTIKTGMRSHMSGDSVEKRTILYSTALVNQARIKREQDEKLGSEGSMFCDEDMQLVFLLLCAFFSSRLMPLLTSNFVSDLIWVSPSLV